MSTEALITDLGQTQTLLLALVEDVDEITLRSQYHPDLSPLGWHLGHCVFTEYLWLHEKLRDDDSVTKPIANLYTPPRTPKAERGKLLPPQQALLSWARELQAFNLHYLRNLRPEWQSHALLEDDYLIHFLIQHNSQHYETMLMVLAQQALTEHQPGSRSHKPLQATELQPELIDIPAGHYRIGGSKPVAYDNEVPPQQADLGPFSIAKTPVSNAEYLAFIEDDGYRHRELWQDNGWNWREENGVFSPDHWRKTDAGDWYAVSVKGSYELAGSEPVSGINYYEARAFASWAKARLPHEYQWETACRIGLLQQTGRVWEWCDNSFHPYEGFTPFPCPEYSQPWLDGKHFSLRGGSLHTRPAIKRPSFRNFFLADKRHVFAGLRLVY
ncbi:MAG: SUMF1/EgtB/PvdO family nonheme iron enzyme [Gammaproteobacteria bacterium]|nr:MAG: SUMF1/EgtB/PvdO family nonheme iron enzyme [Gammaproteobacteria bacterium]